MTEPAPTVWPTLRASDALALIEFLVAAFGFERTVVYTDGDRVAHAQLSWPLGGGIMMGSAASADGGLAPGTFGAYVVCDEPDELCSRALAAGAKILREPQDTEYGSREFAVTDPEGNRWSFGTYRGAARA